MSNKSPFERIYSDHTWGGQSKSGPGSDPSRTHKYRTVLQNFLRTRHVKSVVDIGCGDWTSSQLIDWTGVDYLGIDIVSEVVETNRRKYAAPGVRFETCDATASDPIPSADLLIAKEVLQHLPTVDVQVVLSKLSAFRWAILTNDVEHAFKGGWKRLWTWSPFERKNTDIESGGYRLLSLRDHPFNLPAEELLTYTNHYGSMRWTKEVLLWSRIPET